MVLPLTCCVSTLDGFSLCEQLACLYAGENRWETCAGPRSKRLSFDEIPQRAGGEELSAGRRGATEAHRLREGKGRRENRRAVGGAGRSFLSEPIRSLLLRPFATSLRVNRAHSLRSVQASRMDELETPTP